MPALEALTARERTSATDAKGGGFGKPVALMWRFEATTGTMVWVEMARSGEDVREPGRPAGAREPGRSQSLRRSEEAP
jgi:hypothetical protein